MQKNVHNNVLGGRLSEHPFCQKRLLSISLLLFLKTSNPWVEKSERYQSQIALFFVSVYAFVCVCVCDM